MNISGGPRFRIGGFGRRVLGWLVIMGACAAVAFSRHLDWGMSPIVWVPALCLLPIGFGLKATRVLALHEGARLVIRSEGLFKRSREVPISPAAEIEVVPTAGLRAVVLHQDGHEVPIATWVTAKRAEALVAWLERHLERELPRRGTELHPCDV
ncbi:MAG: hypothetical protein PF961_09930 [Planctomycetota bacterium]|jgi:hypothetical protein|nr:hypothetical protein [Planctomycetota bacterium]